jgi:hypothetical protein
MFLGINDRIMQGTLGDVPFAGAVSCKKLHFASLLFSSNATTNDMAIPLSTTGLRGRGKKKETTSQVRRSSSPSSGQAALHADLAGKAEQATIKEPSCLLTSDLR